MSGEPGTTSHDSGGPDSDSAPTPPRRQPRLSVVTRLVVLGVGWVLILIGILGLALPGLQGILTLLLGSAVLSVASDTVHRLFRRLLHRWPSLSDRFEHLRQKLHEKLARRRDNGHGDS